MPNRIGVDNLNEAVVLKTKTRPELSMQVVKYRGGDPELLILLSAVPNSIHVLAPRALLAIFATLPNAGW